MLETLLRKEARWRAAADPIELDLINNLRFNSILALTVTEALA